MRRPSVWIFGLLFLSLILLVSFQNFSSIPLERLKPQFRRAYGRALSDDIRDFAPRKPASVEDSPIAVPESGSDLRSVTKDWWSRQTQLITHNREKKILEKVHRRMRDWIESRDSQGGAPGEEEAVDGDDPPPFLSSVRFTALNRVELGINNRARVTCSMVGSGVDVDLAQPLSDGLNFGLRHESQTQTNSLSLRVDW